MRKRHRAYLGLFVFLFILTIGMVVAYYTSLVRSSDYVFSTSNLQINIAEGELNFQSLLPGESRELLFVVENVGTSPVHVKGDFDGNWNLPELSANALTVEQFSYRSGSEWLVASAAPFALGEEFFLSPLNAESDLVALAAGDSVEMKLVVVFDADAGNEYQDSFFTGAINLAAKQVEAGAAWPIGY
jgi:hypothetical protein